MKRLKLEKINSLNDLENFSFENRNYLFHAGGTDIITKLRADLYSNDTIVIDISDISELKKIYENNNFIYIGALATHSEISEDQIIKKNVNSLVQGCSVIGAPQIRNRATIGGNLGNSSPVGDTIPPLFVLNASLILKKGKNEREVKINDFFTGPGSNILEKGEIITFIKIPMPTPNISYFKRLGQRKSLAISKLSVAFSTNYENKKLKNVKISLGAVAPTVIYAKKTAEILENNELTKELITKASKMIISEAKPITDVRSNIKYRSSMCGVLLENILNEM